MNEGEIRWRLEYWLTQYYERRDEYPHAYYHAFDFYAGVMLGYLHALGVGADVRKLKRKTFLLMTETYNEPVILAVERAARAVLGMEGETR